jgi:hypothetical protein
MISKRILYSLLVFEIALLAVVATLTYIPNLRKATIYRDDWYYALDRTIGGPQAFHEMFRIDRPARGYFFELYYRLFGIEPAPYHLAGFAWRLLMGASTMWLFLLLWPKQREAALLIALLFLIYPGYTRWMEGFEDQPKAVSLFLQVTSFALTLQAIQARRPAARVACWLGSILSGWGYLALIDYAMGMEAFRFLCVFAFVNRGRADLTIIKKGIATLRAAFPAIFVLGGFLFWRIFLFHNERPETDIKLQLEKLIQSPLTQGAWWLIRLVQSVVNDTVVAWSGYLFQDLFKMDLSKVVLGLIIGLVTTAITILGIFWMKKYHWVEQPARPEDCPPRWQNEAIWIGLLGVIAGVVPVVMANRSVEFGALSHYGLPASLASATLLVGLLYSLRPNSMRVAAGAMLVLLAVLTQYTAGEKVTREEQIISNFWQQVAWRAPGIREATGLVVNYPTITIGEDIDMVFGPANFMYYPETTNELPVRYKLFPTKQYPWTVKEYLAGGKVKIEYRSHYGVIDYEHLLVLSQGTVDSCVHIIDRQWPWYSYNDPDEILVIGQSSYIRNIFPKADKAPNLPTSIMGAEPEHGWCYYFEKAELALQQQDWNTITTLEDEAARLGLKPAERLEWMPFLQAYAFLGNAERFAATAAKMKADPYSQVQTCGVMTNMQKVTGTFQAPIQEQIKRYFCISPSQ